LRGGRALQEGGGAAIPSAIIVVQPGKAVSFETTAEHFPVYLKDSSFNTNPNFDDGVFDTLKTKITGSGIAIASFAYTFAVEGVYVFGDYADSRSQTIVIVSPTLTPVIEPLTAENLQRLGVAPLAPEMQVLPFGLAVVGPLFIAASLAGLLLQNILELRIQRREVKRARRAVSVGKDYDDLNKKESILAYIDDLHSLIRQNLDEMKEKIAQGEDRKKLRELIDDKLNVMNELKGNSKDDLKSIMELTNYMLENLRFADGRSLKDCLEERRLKRGADGAEDDADGPASGWDEDDYGSEEEAGMGEEGDQGDGTGQESVPGDSSSELTDELEAEERERNRQVNDAALELLVSAEADINRRKEQVAESLGGLQEEEKRGLLKHLDRTMNDVTRELELAQKK